MLRVDFHTHTSASKDSQTPPAVLIRAGRARGLDRLVVTDHNTIQGALLAHKLDPEFIIVGEEIMTTRGEILAAFVKKDVPMGLSPLETIRRLRDQGAFISVSHPFDTWRGGAWRLEDLLEIAPLVDAIEVFNARCMSPAANRRARQFAEAHSIAGTAGSDAHAAFEIGAACLITPFFRDAEELRQNIRAGSVAGKLSPFWVHFYSRIAASQKSVV